MCKYATEELVRLAALRRDTSGRESEDVVNDLVNTMRPRQGRLAVGGRYRDAFSSVNQCQSAVLLIARLARFQARSVVDATADVLALAGKRTKNGKLNHWHCYSDEVAYI